MNRLLNHLGVALFFIVLTVVFTFPMYRYLDTGVPYSFNPEPGNEIIPLKESDTVQQYYHFWMAWDYVNGGPGPFFRDPYEFKMEPGSESIFTTRRLFISILFILLAPFGTVAAFNLLLMLTLFLSCYFSFLLARFYCGKTFPSMVAGVIFGLCPFALAQSMGGHTNGYLLWLIPFMLLCFEMGLKTNKSIYYLLTAISFSCFALTEYHLFYYSAMLFPPFFIWRILFLRPGWKRVFKAIIMMGIAAGIGGVAMFFVKSFEINVSFRSVNRSFREVLNYTAPWTNLFTKDFENIEKVIYVGIPVLVSTFVSFLFFGWKRSLFWLYMGIFLSFGLLCLGPEQTPIRLYEIFHQHLPYFGLARVPGRMMVMVMLGAAVLTAMGLSRLKKLSVWVSILMLVLVVWDYMPRTAIGITLLPPKSPIYEAIKKDIGDKSVLCLPIWPGDTAWSSHYLYQVTQYPVPIVNGYYPTVPKNYIEHAFYPLYSVNVGELSERQWTLLKQFNVKYVVLHEEAFPGKVSHFPARVTLEHLMNSPYLRFVMHVGPQTLFEVLNVPRKVEPTEIHSPIGAFFMNQRLHSTDKYLANVGLQIFPPGEYSAEIDVAGTGNQPIPMKLLGRDPFKRQNRKYTGFETIKEDKLKIGKNKFNFKLEKGLLPQFVIERPENSNCKVERLIVCLKNSKETPYLLEAEDMYVGGRVVQDETASNKMAVYANPYILAPQQMVFGPYREYPAGDYKVTYWIKTETNLPYSVEGNRNILDVDVSADYGIRVFAKLPLKFSDLNSEGRYQPVTLSFSLKEPEVLEFRAKYLRQIPVYIDKIEIEKNGKAYSIRK